VLGKPSSTPWHEDSEVVRLGIAFRRRGSDMGDYGVSVTWGDPKPGREAKALELFMESVAVNDKAVADGRIERWDSIFFEPTGSPPAGASRFYGSREQIEAFITAEDTQNIIQRAGLLLQNFGYRRFVTGDALAEIVGAYGQLVTTL
jgi:hypothetical protein